MSYKARAPKPLGQFHFHFKLNLVNYAARCFYNLSCSFTFQFGSVSKEKLLGLLAFALCSDAIHTVQSARELIDSGVEPLDLVSQLGTVMRDILSGSSQQMTQKQKDGGCFSDSSKCDISIHVISFNDSIDVTFLDISMGACCVRPNMKSP